MKIVYREGPRIKPQTQISNYSGNTYTICLPHSAQIYAFIGHLDWICKNNSHNPLRFTLDRETDTKKAEKFCKTLIFE